MNTVCKARLQVQIDFNKIFLIAFYGLNISVIRRIFEEVCTYSFTFPKRGKGDRSAVDEDGKKVLR